MLNSAPVYNSIMQILVAVTEVAVVDDEFVIDGLDIAETYLTYDLNEWDNYAIEEAVQLSEADDDIEVVTVTVGPERSEEVIRQGLAKGADRALRVWDTRLDDLGVLDPVTKAQLLAAVVEEEEPDLVLAGVQSGDDAYGATGVALAQFVDYEWAAVVNSLELDRDEGTASVHRELEGGIEEMTDLEIPAVLTIQSGINDPRYASLRGIRQAQSKPLDVHTLETLDCDIDELGETFEATSLYEPEAESDATIFDGDATETATELSELLRDTGVVDG
jgi:electron transfer flavoprotein beta subunit